MKKKAKASTNRATAAPATKGVDFAKLMGLDVRDPAQRKIVNRAEDMVEDILERQRKRRGASPVRGLSLTPEQWALLIAFVMGQFGPKPPAPAPVPVPVPEPGAPPVPPAPPVKPPKPPSELRFIRDGRYILTGATVGGPLGPRVGEASLRWLAGDDSGTPLKQKQVDDIRFETDFTPKDQNGKAFGPNDPSWEEPPNDTAKSAAANDQGQPDIAPCSPLFEAGPDPDQAGHGEWSVDISREYRKANKGCSPRFRGRTDPGQGIKIMNPRIVGPDYDDGEGPAVVPLTLRDGTPIEFLRVGRGA
jgi:hypothetical protein